jgi:hypothetical protein
MDLPGVFAAEAAGDRKQARRDHPAMRSFMREEITQVLRIIASEGRKFRLRPFSDGRPFI